MRRILILAALLVPSAAFSQESPAEKVILSFEDDEIRKIVDGFKIDRKETKDAEGRVATVSIEKPFFLYPKWTLVAGKGSHGEYAFGLGFARRSHVEETPDVLLKPPPDSQRLYGVFRDNYAAILNTCGVFRRLMPMDWSAHDVLRLDVYAMEGEQTIRVQLEDEEIAP